MSESTAVSVCEFCRGTGFARVSHVMRCLGNDLMVHEVEPCSMCAAGARMQQQVTAAVHPRRPNGGGA